MSAPAHVEASGICKTFGSLRALDDVRLDVPAGTFHAIVGENGAGKSTLAKCLLGFYHPDAGEVKLDGALVSTPVEARRAGLGMVFQHFTLAPSLTVTENLVMARADLPAILDWNKEKQRLRTFLDRAPFAVDLDARVQHLAAKQKQKVEILKQLYLETKVLILDEPTSVLTPSEADEVMAVLRKLVEQRVLSVILITHKLREVMSFADHVTGLRRGRWVASTEVSKTDVPALTSWIMGNAPPPEQAARKTIAAGDPMLQIHDLSVLGDHGVPVVKNLSLTVRAGEILGIAGVSGNGQRELVQAVGGQREIEAGSIRAHGRAYHPTREGIREAALFTLPEEPLQNAAVPRMSVEENIALRSFDRAPIAKAGLLDRSALRKAAEELIHRFSIQRELVQAVGGQREIEAGSIRAHGRAYHPTREGIREAALFTLPEEPLQNAAVPRMSVEENIALRSFDRAPIAKAGLLDRSALRKAAEELIHRFSIRTPSPATPIRNLSGGNVQRAVLARDLGNREPRIMVAANPCFGLDLGAAAFVQNQLMELRNEGGAVLLISEDLDELLKMSDRIAVMSGGEIAHEAPREELDLAVVGRHMSGHA